MKHYEIFLDYLNKENRDQAISYALDLVQRKELSLIEMYQNLLVPALVFFECKSMDEDICIWKEHFRTSIIRTILESCYVIILDEVKEKRKIDQKIVVLTPAFEYHEIGAIIVSHLLKLEGFDAYYIGANTPKSEIVSALRAYQPDYLAMSVTNPYNLVVTKQITEEVKRFFPEIKIILGGQAFLHEGALENISADYILHSFNDIKRFADEVSA